MKIVSELVRDMENMMNLKVSAIKVCLDCKIILRKKTKRRGFLDLSKKTFNCVGAY